MRLGGLEGARAFLFLAAAVAAGTIAAGGWAVPSLGAGAPRSPGDIRGTIRGTVINATDGRPQAGVKIILGAVREDGTEVTRHSAVTNERGRFAFPGLSADDGLAYTIDARYGDGLFSGGAIRIPANRGRRPVIATRLKVWETTEDPDVIRISRMDIFVVPAKDRVGVVESVAVDNTSDRAYIGRGRALRGEQEQDSPVPTIGFALPEGASTSGVTLIEADIDIPRTLITDFGFAAVSAFPPGTTRVTFSYQLGPPAGPWDISRTALYPVEELSVFAAGRLEVNSNRLQPASAETIGGKRYARWSASAPLAAGDALQAVALPKGESSGPLIGVAAAATGLLALGGLAALLRSRRSARRKDARSLRTAAGRSDASPSPATRPAPAPAEAPARPRPEEPEEEETPPRDELLVAIAELDLRYEAGELAEEEWARLRAEMKSQLRAERAP